MIWSFIHDGWRYELHHTGMAVCPETGQWIFSLRTWHHGEPRNGVTLRYHPMESWLRDIAPATGSRRRVPIAVLDELHGWLDKVDGWAA